MLTKKGNKIIRSCDKCGEIIIKDEKTEAGNSLRSIAAKWIDEKGELQWRWVEICEFCEANSFLGNILKIIPTKNNIKYK